VGGRRLHGDPRGEALKRGLAILVLGGALAAWLGRERVLATMGALVVAEDPLQATDAIVVSVASTRAGALGAARLYRQKVAPLVVVSRLRETAADRDIRALGVTLLASHDLARAVLERSGVPRGAIAALDHPVEGTGEEIEVLAAFARARKLRSLCYLTARTHTARARWLLRRELPGTTVVVRAVELPEFAPDAWWHDRGQTRELAIEMVRWMGELLPAFAPATAQAR